MTILLFVTDTSFFSPEILEFAESKPSESDVILVSWPFSLVVCEAVSVFNDDTSETVET